MNAIQHLVEAALYVDDLDQAEAFSRDVLGLDLISKEPGRHAFFRAGQGVLLIFNPEATGKGGLSRHVAEGPGRAAWELQPTRSMLGEAACMGTASKSRKKRAWPLAGGRFISGSGR